MSGTAVSAMQVPTPTLHCNTQQESGIYHGIGFTHPHHPPSMIVIRAYGWRMTDRPHLSWNKCALSKKNQDTIYNRKCHQRCKLMYM